MMRLSADERGYMTELTRAIVREVAPEELELFDELIAELDATPQDSASQRTRDDPLGFGAGELVTAITPVAAAMVSAALAYIGTELLKLVGDQVVQQVRQRAAELFDRDGTASTLSKQQLEQIRLRAYREARSFGVEAAVAEQMARALIGSLALTER